MIHVIGLSIYATLSLEKTGLFPTISFGEVNFSLGGIILYIGELGPFLGKIGMIGGICLSHVFSFVEMKLSATFSLEEKNPPFGGVNLPLEEKALCLEKHSLNLPASFSL